MNGKYTLKDPIFRSGLVAGSEAGIVMPLETKMVVVGGGATQLYLGQESDLLRSTTDVDFFSRHPTGKTERRAWAKYAADIMKRQGYETARGGLSRYGAEVRFDDVLPAFLVHLDTWGNNFFQQHERWIHGEFERARISKIDGGTVHYISPLDVMVGKIHRVEQIRKHRERAFNTYQTNFFDKLKDAQFDDVDTTRLDQNLLEIERERAQTLEDLGRFGYREIIDKFDCYKIDKDIQDITTLIEAMRAKGERIDKHDFRSICKEALE